ncbi:MAG: RidA family protein [Candidatus Eremiobacteraeota bacterium]|nr:RidA family protein [Candidatus Eremiobacteraeota bacterium]
MARTSGALDLLVDDENDEARRLYRRVGFAWGAPDPAVPERLRLVYSAPALTRKPFRDAVWAGDTLYLSGRIGLDPATGKPPPEAADEARLVMDGIAAVLGAEGLTMKDLAMVTIYTPVIRHFETFNAVYLSYFDEELPARAFLGSGPLLFGARFEVLAIAARPR